MQDETQETAVRETVSQDGNTTVQRQTVATRKSISGVVLAQRIIWFIIGVINTIIGLRFVLLLFGANRDVPFTDFIYRISEPLVAPFAGMFGQPVYGRAVFELSSLFAMLIYTLIGIGIAKALTIARPQDEI